MLAEANANGLAYDENTALGLFAVARIDHVGGGPVKSRPLRRCRRPSRRASICSSP